MSSEEQRALRATSAFFPAQDSIDFLACPAKPDPAITRLTLLYMGRLVDMMQRLGARQSSQKPKIGLQEQELDCVQPGHR